VSRAVLELSGIVAGYGDTTVLRDVDLLVPEGSVVALLGPNGAGKTTLLRVASGLMQPTRGRAVLDGIDVTRSRAFERTRAGLCLIPEGRGVYPSLTVAENLKLHAFKGQEEVAFARATEAFPVLGQKLRQPAGELSGGQQQMLALARAYVQEARLVLVDEASMGLAPVLVDEIFDFLKRISTSGTSLLIVEQYVSRALAIADRVYVLNKGAVVFGGEPKELGNDIFDHYLGTAAASR